MTMTMPIEGRQETADAIRARIDDGADIVHFIYEPGDSTHYEYVLVRLDAAGPLVGGVTIRPQVMPAHMESGRWLLADGATFMHAMTVDLTDGHYTDPQYIGEKLHVGLRQIMPASAVVLAELLNMITRCEHLDSMRASYPHVFPEQVAR